MGLKNIPSEVFDLVELENLDLAENELTSVPAKLWNLPGLRRIVLWGNQLESLLDRPIPNRLRVIIDAQTFRRCGAKCAAENLQVFFGEDGTTEDAIFLIGALNQGSTLGSLTLGKWDVEIGEQRVAPTEAIQKILDSLAGFQGLQSLSVRGLAMGSVPAGISQLRQIKSLSIDALGLKQLPDWIGKLALERLSAIDNHLTDIPSSLGDMAALKELKLVSNPLDHIPAIIFELASLERLEMRYCNIREVPSDILRLGQLKRFFFNRQTVQSPPPEISYKGLEAIRDYWRQRQDSGVDYLCEAKLIILGEPGAGKTSLAQKIKNPDYQLRSDEASTEGIDVLRWHFPAAIRTRETGQEKLLQRDFQVSIWDFGGQEIYHATHQFFLTRRSLYVLVCDDRKEDTDFSYWLRIVEMLSDGSPVLIIQNEKQNRSRDINLSGLRAQFLNLKEAIPTNLEDNRGLDRVIQSIQRELQQLPHIGTGLPATWKRVRQALEQDPRDHITLTHYLDICSQHGFTNEKDKLQLSGYLHDLGICLHFQDDAILKHLVVLKPSWGTDAVYRVLDAPEVINSRGRFTKAQLRSIWSEAKYTGMHDELLQLMMKFQLCYKLETDSTYIAPQLLSSDQPTYTWEPTGSLVVRYQYDFLPKGILSRFIVAMHHLIAEGGKLVWKTGVVLEREGVRAEVIEDYSQRRIRVRIRGSYPQGLFAVIDEQLERLHASFPRLKYERYLPCPCKECSAKPEPYGFPLETLVKVADKNKEIQCHESLEMVDATRLVIELLPGALLSGPSRSITIEPEVSPPAPPSPEVFVSYAWTDASKAIVDQLQQAFADSGTRLHRDRDELNYKDSIREFMQRLGQGKCVVVVISEKYLKSDNCMFELTQIAKAENLCDRIFPIILPDANLFKPLGRVGYIKYWEDQKAALNAALKGVDGENLASLQAELTTYAEIRRLLDGITGTMKDMNALTPPSTKTPPSPNSSTASARSSASRSANCNRRHAAFSP